MTASNADKPNASFSQQLNQLLQATNTLIHSLSGPTDKEALLSQTIQSLCSLTQASCGSVALLSDNQISQFVTYGMDNAIQQTEQLTQNKRLMDTSREACKSFRIDDVQQSELADTLPLHHQDAKTLLVVPICTQERFYGQIYLYNKEQQQPFTEIDEQLANHLSSSLALVLSNLQHRDANEKAEEKINLHAKVFENSAEAIIITDAQCNILSVNEAFVRITQYDREEVIGQTPTIISQNKPGDLFYKRMWQHLEDEGYWHGEIWDRRKNGEAFPAWLSISTIKNNQGITTNYIGLLSDISERKQFQKQIQYYAYYDSLTDLPNRSLFLDRVRQLISQYERNKRPFAILSINIDHFKNINETLSHTEGDKLLRQIASRLLRTIRSGDTAARLGGDKFAITLSNLKQIEDAVDAAEKIRSTLTLPFFVHEQEVFITASIGVSAYPSDTDDAATLIKHAEAAMFHIKAQTPNSLQFYEPEIIANSNRRYQLEISLRNALRNGEFVLHYQPKINLNSWQINSVEALLRWQHPERGLIQPKEFIPLLEESGQIIPIGKWVLETACAQINEWIKQGIEPPVIAVNVSPRQFERNSFIRTIQDVLMNNACNARYLEIEITESALMNDVKSASATLRKLREMGVHISVDDFGTGYSSLAYLSRFPIDTLKIDRTFIQDVTCNQHDATITRSVVDLAHNLGIRALAEGIETQKQLEFLCELGCDAGQGFIFSHPIPEEELTKRLRETSHISPAH